MATRRARLTKTQPTLAGSENARSAYLARSRRAPYDREAQADLKRQAASKERQRRTGCAGQAGDTFTFTRYRTIDWKVSVVTADAVNDEKRGAIFSVTVTLERTDIAIDGKRIRLAPGMNLTAEIKTGKRKAIEYLLSPNQKAPGESLKER